MAKNMTEGKSLPLILQFALPLLLGNLLQQTYNIIDSAIVGKELGANALASVGASSSVQFLVIGFCLGTCSGFGVPVAKSFGAGRYDEMRSHVFHGILLTVVFAVVLTAACALLCPQILHLLSTPKDIFPDAYRYLLVIFLGIPFTLAYNLLAGILRAIGDSRTPFIFLAISTVLNIGLDFFCILVLRWGCTGAAIATVMSQVISSILCLIYIIKKVPLLHLTKEDCQIKGRGIQTMMVMGVPMGLQYSITAIGSMVMQSANNGLGSIYVSGFTAGMRIKQFLICPFDAIATAVSVFCGQNLGAGKPKRIRQGIWQGMIVGVSYGVVAGLIMIFAGRVLSMMFIDADETAILDAAAQYLRYMGFFFWTLGILNVCRMCTQGLGYSGRAIFSGVTEMVARILVSQIFVGTFGFTAICFTDQAAWVSACIYIIPTCVACVRKVSKQLTSGSSGAILEESSN